MDRWSTSRSGPPARCRCRSTRPPRPSRSSWILADSGASAVHRRDRRARRDASSRGPRPAAGAARRVADRRRRRWTSWPPPAPTVADAEIDERRAGVGARRPRHDHLHLGHHRPAQGLRADPRQLPGADRERRRRGLGDVVSAEGASTLLFLPLAHVFARFIQVLRVDAGARLGHTADIKNLLPDLATLPARRSSWPCRGCSRRSTTPPSRRPPPRARARSSTAAADTADRLQPRRLGRTAAPGPVLRAPARALRPAGLRQAAAALGGRVALRRLRRRAARRRLGHFFRGIGVTVLEGYGLTETTAPATVNRPAASRSAPSAARCRASPSAIADDGEILIKGDNVFAGYWNNDDGHRARRCATAGSAPATSASSTTTASCGSPAARRRSSSPPAARTSRPAVLEDRLRAHPLVSQCMVVGDRKPFIAALVTLDAEMLPRLGRQPRRSRALTVDAGPRPTSVVLAEIQKAVDDANKAVSPGRVDPQVRDPRGRLHRGERLPHPVAEAQAQRRDEGLRRPRSRPSTAARRE